MWSAIATVAGLLERRVWVETSQSPVFPNLYTLLVAPPGVGKNQAIDHAPVFWLSQGDLKVAPDSLTKAALIDALAEAKQNKLYPGNILVEYTSLLVSAPELGVLLTGHDLEFLSVLNYIFDNPPYYRERRRHFKDGKPIEIYRPQLNILAGTQPAYLANLLPEEAWGMGFMSRIIMVYAREAIYVPLFQNRTERAALKASIVSNMVHRTKMFGKMDWEPDAAHEMEAWHKAGGPPRPEHSKLEHYIQRRTLHILKLCQISSASRGTDRKITLFDLDRARSWLFLAEETMPDVFKDMVYKGDAHVLQDLHFFAWKLWSKEKKPIHESRLINFLKNKVPSEKIQKILDIADRANIITRQAGSDLWVPKAIQEHGNA